MNELRVKIGAVWNLPVVCREFSITQDGIFDANGDFIANPFVSDSFEIEVASDCGSCLDLTSGSINYSANIGAAKGPNKLHKFYHISDRVLPVTKIEQPKPVQKESETMAESKKEPQMTPNEVFKQYFELKDFITSKNKEFTAYMSEYIDILAKMASFLEKALHASHADSLKFDNGTIFYAKKTYTNVADYDTFVRFTANEALKAQYGDNATDEFVNFIVDIFLSEGPLHFHTQAVRKSAILEYMKEHNDIPPTGIKVETERVAQIRRPLKSV